MKLQVKVKGTRPTYGTDDRGMTIEHNETLHSTYFTAECDKLLRVCFNTSCDIVYKRGAYLYCLRVSKNALLRCETFAE